MKSIKQALALFMFITILSCSSDGSDDNSTGTGGGSGTLPTVTTETPLDITGFSARLRGNVVNSGGNEDVLRGFCWSLNPNPTISDYSTQADGSGLGSFYVDVDDYLEPNTTYHVRAFAYGNGGNVAYGNNITFTTGAPVSFIIDIPRNINTTRVDINVIVEGNGTTSIGDRGVAIHTSANPTVDHIVVDGGYGVGEFGGQVSNLNHNTVYYTRPYAYFNGEYFYGEQQTFRTTGYFGPAGGYVVFDKGETTEGWRYLEASPEQSSFYNDWGCDGTFISNTYEDFGAGLANTNQIVGNCAEASFAPRTAYYYSYGGYSDWFLPSRLEAIVTMRSLSDLNALENSSHWTSTEVNSSQAYYIYMSSGNIISTAGSKTNSRSYLPIRRY